VARLAPSEYTYVYIYFLDIFQGVGGSDCQAARPFANGESCIPLPQGIDITTLAQLFIKHL